MNSRILTTDSASYWNSLPEVADDGLVTAATVTSSSKRPSVAIAGKLAD